MQYMETNCNIAFDCKYHVVWCTKYRRKVLTAEIEDTLKQVVSDVCEERNATIIEMEADADHFHILVSCDPQYGIHRLIQQQGILKLKAEGFTASGSGGKRNSRPVSGLVAAVEAGSPRL